MKEILENLKNEKMLCSIYTDANDTEKFSVGFVISYDDNFFLLESVDPYGKTDGIFCDPIEKIIRVAYENNYCEKINKLYHYFKQDRCQNILLKDNVILDIIQFAKKNHKVCAFELCDNSNSDIFGFIQKYEKGLIFISVLDFDGRVDGKSIIKLEDITRISCDSADENKLEILFNLQNLSFSST